MRPIGAYKVDLGAQHWMGMTKENHLGELYQIKPQLASKIMVQLLATNRGKTLDTFLEQFPTKEFESDEEYYWDVIGSSRRNVELKEARTIDGTVVTAATVDNVGVGTEPFYLVFSEKWFADGEFIVGNLNEKYQFRVLGEPRVEGTDYVYKVELAGGNTTGCPPERLLQGEKFSVEAAFVEKELSRKVGDVRFTSPVKMKNEFSTIRIQHKVPGNMLDKKLGCGIPVKDEKTGKVKEMQQWMHYVEWEVENQFNDYKNMGLVFGRSNRNVNGEYMNIGKSGSPIKTGAGLYEQMEMANTQYYNHFSLKTLTDALCDLCESKLGFGERKFILRTGERGARQFNEAVKQDVSGWYLGNGFQINADQLGMIKKTSSNLHQNALSAGYQFTEYQAPNGVIVQLQVDPYYDDQVRNKIRHPKGGVAFSYRYDIMDMGTMDQPNIFKCKVKGQEDLRGYQWGLRNPYTGQIGNPNMSYDEDSATFHRMSTFGICVLDPTRTISLIPSILQG